MHHHSNRAIEGTGLAAVAVAITALAVFASGGDVPRPTAPVAVDAAALPHRALPPAPTAPVQAALRPRAVELGHGKTAHLKHAYAIEGVVLTRGRYRFDAMSDISPLDLGIVTGTMARPEALAHIRAAVGPRMTIFHLSPDPPLPSGADSRAWFTNNHVIPATGEVRDTLPDIETGDRVRIEGFLADVSEGGRVVWATSERREDTWCEIIVVTAVRALDGAAGPAARPTVRRGGRVAPAG